MASEDAGVKPAALPCPGRGCSSGRRVGEGLADLGCWARVQPSQKPRPAGELGAYYSRRTSWEMETDGGLPGCGRGGGSDSDPGQLTLLPAAASSPPPGRATPAEGSSRRRASPQEAGTCRCHAVAAGSSAWFPQPRLPGVSPMQVVWGSWWEAVVVCVGRRGGGVRVVTVSR